MSTSSAQAVANRTNAQKSTGPRSVDGKQIVSQNAVRHGVFSKQMVLQGESGHDFDSLLGDLGAALRPVGILEQALVERIAITLWRQRRLVRAETAALELCQQLPNIANDVNIEMGIGLSAENAIKEADLEPYDPKEVEWCHAVISEYGGLDFDRAVRDLTFLEKQAPKMYAQLVMDAEEAFESPEDYLTNWKDPREFFFELWSWCHDQLKVAEHRPHLLAIAALVRNRRSILPYAMREKLAKYQVQLDNEFYKAIKALREAQAWRLGSIEPVPAENGFVPEKAA